MGDVPRIIVTSDMVNPRYLIWRVRNAKKNPIPESLVLVKKTQSKNILNLLNGINKTIGFNKLFDSGS